MLHRFRQFLLICVAPASYSAVLNVATLQEKIFMKSLLSVLLLSCIFGLNLSAQRLRITDTANRWVVRGGQTNAPNWTALLLKPGRDTICYSHVYKIIEIENFSYHFGGHQGPYNQLGLFREDTLARKAWFVRDSIEHLIYDSSWAIGDTLKWAARFSSRTGFAVVQAIDSTQVNNLWYKVFRFNNQGSSTAQFTIVEGFGCDKGPGFPAFPYTFENYVVLNCFTNNSFLPFTVGINPTLPLAGQCNLPLTIETAKRPSKDLGIRIVPNPASARSVIELFYKMRSGIVHIYNNVGGLVATAPFSNSSTISLPHGDYQSGLYLIKVTDLENGNEMVCRFQGAN